VLGIFFKWRAKGGREQDFVAAWSELTLIIRDHCGGLGSRLHKSSDGYLFAYAQWPSEDEWKRERPVTQRMHELRGLMAESAELVEGPLSGEVIEDLLI
jgi:hypothetical protein